MFRISQIGEVWDYDTGNGPQPLDDYPRFVQPSHMGIAGCEIAIRVGEARILLVREQQLWDGCVEAAQVKKRRAYREERPTDPGARAESQRHFGMRNRDLGLAGIQSQHTADEPAARE